MITIKDMSGLIPPHRVSKLVKLFKQNLNVPIDFHTHCTPGYGLASVLAAIVAGVDIVDTNCWYFSGGTGAPAIELIYVFCKKLGSTRVSTWKPLPRSTPSSRRSAKSSKFRSSAKRSLCRSLSIRSPTNFRRRSTPNSTVRSKQRRRTTKRRCSTPATDRGPFRIPGTERTGQEGRNPGRHVLQHGGTAPAAQGRGDSARAMELIPTVRLAAGLPPLVTPTLADRGCPGRSCALTKGPDGRCTRPRVRNSLLS